MVIYNKKYKDKYLKGKNMKTIKKLPSVLLAALMCLSVFALASCGDTGEGDTTTASPAVDTNGSDSTAEDTSPKFDEADYGGDTFTVYMRNSTATHYPGIYIFCPENATDLVNEQTQIRNQIVEEKYNIQFNFIEAASPQDSMKNDLAGGDVPYDVVLAQRNYLSGLVYAGLLRNFNELDIDYTTTWWDKNAADTYTYDGKLFTMPNDVSVSNLAGCRFWYFHKGVVKDFNLKSPYEYVAENQWTVDNFFTLVKSVSAPGAEGQFGVYGLSNEEGSVRNHMLTGIASFRVDVDSDGNIECKIGTDYAEKTQEFFDQLKAVCEDSSICLDFKTARSLDTANQAKYGDMYYHTRALFSQGHFLFTQTSMLGAVSTFEESEEGVSPVMNPKYNTDQAEYYHQIDNNAILWCLPKSANADLDQLTNVLDFWAYTSSSTVMESFYELVMKTKRASDPQTAEMYDIIKSTIKYYITDTFTIDISSFITAAYNTSVASAWKSNQRKIVSGLKDIQDKIQAVE